MARRVISFDVGERNLAFCDVVTSDGAQCTPYRLGRYDISTTAGSKTGSTIAAACSNMVSTLSQLFGGDYDLRDVDHIIIEQQMGRDNIRMKVLSHIIQTYFDMQKIQDDKLRFDIRFVSPKSRDVLISETIDSELIKNVSRKYASVMAAAKIFPKEFDVFAQTAAKQDDLADAMLNALIFVRLMMAKTNSRTCNNSMMPTRQLLLGCI